MLLHQRTILGLAHYSYLIADETTRSCAVIDPARDVEPYLNWAKKNHVTITDILETHVHADFVSGACELKARLDGKALIHCSGMGGQEWIPKYADHILVNQDIVSLGVIALQAIHTPGHTPEHIVWALIDTSRSDEIPLMYFTGDFLFSGSIGRPDLLGEQLQKKMAHELYESVFQTLATFSEFATVLPSHGSGSLCGKAIGTTPTSSIGYEKRLNPALIQKPEDLWVEQLMHDMPPFPSYFARMKKINVEGPAILGAEYPGQRRLEEEEFKEVREKGCTLLDVRKQEELAGGYIPGSINIPLSAQLSTWSGWLLPYDKPIVLVVENRADLLEAITQLIRIGHDSLVGYLEGVSIWPKEQLEHFQQISVETAEQMIKTKQAALIDVRQESEWQAGHIQDAIHIPLGLLSTKQIDLPKDQNIVMVCGGGYRSAIATSILKQKGFHNVSNMIGGMHAWKQAKKSQITLSN